MAITYRCQGDGLALDGETQDLRKNCRANAAGDRRGANEWPGVLKEPGAMGYFGDRRDLAGYDATARSITVEFVNPPDQPPHPEEETPLLEQPGLSWRQQCAHLLKGRWSVFTTGGLAALTPCERPSGVVQVQDTGQCEQKAGCRRLCR